MQNEDLKLLASKSFASNHKTYEIIDFLNKSLKDKNIIFGLKKNESEDNNIYIYVYEVS